MPRHHFHTQPLSVFVGVFSLLLVSLGVMTGTLVLDFSRSRGATVELYKQTFENSIITPTPAFAKSNVNMGYFDRSNAVGPRVGNYAFKFAGNDTSNTSNSYSYYKIADVNILISENTVLEYKIAPQNTFGQNVGVDLKIVNADGTYFGHLRDQDIYAEDAILMHPAFQKKHASFTTCCPLNALTNIKTNLGRLRGKKIAEVIVGYDDFDVVQQGPFDARIDDLKIINVDPFRAFPLGSAVITTASQLIKLNLNTGALASATKQAIFELGTVIDGPVNAGSYLKDLSGNNILGSDKLWRVDFTSNIVSGLPDTSAIDGWIRGNYLQIHPSDIQINQAISKSTEPDFTPVKGDMDDTGTVTVTDGVAILRCASGLNTGSNICSTIPIDLDTVHKADMNCDGSVTVTDGVSALRKAAGLSVEACKNYKVAGGYRERTDTNPSQCTTPNPLTGQCNCPSGFTPTKFAKPRGTGFATGENLSPAASGIYGFLRYGDPFGVVGIPTSPVSVALFFIQVYLFGFGDGSPGSPGSTYICTQLSTNINDSFQGGYMKNENGNGMLINSLTTQGYSCPAGNDTDRIANVLGSDTDDKGDVFACRYKLPDSTLGGTNRSSYGGMFHLRDNGQCLRGNPIGEYGFIETLGLRAKLPSAPGYSPIEYPVKNKVKDDFGAPCSCRAGYEPLPIADVTGAGGKPGVIWLCQSPYRTPTPKTPTAASGVITGKTISKATGAGVNTTILISDFKVETNSEYEVTYRAQAVTAIGNNNSFGFGPIKGGMSITVYAVIPEGYNKAEVSICTSTTGTCSHNSFNDLGNSSVQDSDGARFVRQKINVSKGEYKDLLFRFY